MSRILKVMVVLLAITAMVAPSVFAEDRLSLAGEMRVRGMFYQYDDGTNDRSHAWNDQRLRIGGKIAVAEGVSVNFRFDATESDENSSDAVAWGGSSSSYAGGSAYQYSQRRGDIQFDKAYLQIVKNGYTLMAGQMYFGGFGIGKQLDVVGAGFTVKKAGLTLSHVKRMDKNAGKNGFGGTTGYDDMSLTAAKYDIKGDGFSVTPMVSYNVRQSTDVERLGLGVYATVNLNAIAIKGELDYFNGENAAAADEKGIQLYLDGSMAVSDTVKVGLIGLYAQGQDGGDVQVTNNNNDGTVDWTFAEWHPENYGYYSTEFVNDFDTFDPSGSGAGVLGAVVYSDVKVSDDLGMKFSAGYLETEDDGIYDLSGYILNAGASYAVATNTALNTQINYTAMDDAGTDKDQLAVISGLHVKF